MSLKLNEQEIQAILAEVEGDLAEVLKSEPKKLAKGFGEKSSEGSSPEGSEGSSAEGSSAEGSSAEVPPMPTEGSSAEGSSAEGSEGSSAEGSSAEGSSAGMPPMAPEGAPAEGAPAAAPEQDLESKLSALPEDQLRHLYMAAKQAIFARMQQATPAAPPAAPPAGPAAPPASPDMAMKGEMKSNPANGNVTKKSEVDELNQKVELLTKAVSILGAPIRKAVVSLNHVEKPGSEPMQKAFSKSEITAKLTQKTRDPSLSKADRNVINDWYSGNVGVDQIAHLLK